MLYCSELTYHLSVQRRSVLQCVAVCCSAVQCVAVCCSELTYHLPLFNVAQAQSWLFLRHCVKTQNRFALQITATRCSKYAATHCNTLQQTAMHYTTLCQNSEQVCTATSCNTLQHIVTHCNRLQHAATYCNTLQHTATHYTTMC